MKVSIQQLRRFVALPDGQRAVRDLLDDIGVEVKRQDDTGQLTLELLANRGDHHCYVGVAREIGGRTGAVVKMPEVAPLSVGASPVRLSCDTPLVFGYSATMLERGPDADDELPADLVAPLLAAGQSPVHPAVDATNLANLELGQPTHAFDASRIVGGITLRTSRPGETAWLLFTPEPRDIPAGTLVVADDVKILAIAGVIGCEDSKTTAETTRIVLESATFDPVAVRKAARALGVHTDASARFERGADPTAMIPGAGRVAAILGRVGWRVVGTTGVVGHPLPAPPIVPIDVAAAAAFLEHPLTEDEVRSRLTRYGFDVSPAWPDWSDDEGWEDVPALDSVPKDRLRTTLLVRVPGHRRWDVETTFDLYEELAKSIGYNQTPERLPPIDLGAVPSTLEKNRQLVDQALVAAGFFEIFTDGFYGRDLLERAGVGAGHPLAAHVETANALDRGYSLLKNQCVLQAVDAVATNLRLKTEEIRAFEWTRTFRPDPTADNGVCTEHPVLWAIACGAARTPGWDGAQRRFDAFHAKALVEALSTATRIPLSLSAPEEDEGHAVSSLLHPKRQLLIRDAGQVVGVVGEIHPAVIKGFKLKKERPIYVEINAAVFGRAPVRPDYVEPPVHQPIDRALAFTLPRGVEAGAIVAQLVRSGPAWLRGVRVTDEYLHPDADGARTLTFSLSFAQDADPRTSDEVNAASEAMIRAVEARFGPAGVKLR